MEILFNLIIPKCDFSQIECMNDFVELVQSNLSEIIDIHPKKKAAEILFIEKADDSESLLIHCKDKCSLDLEGKDLVIFLLEQPDVYKKDSGEVQTQCLPLFEYTFNPTKPKSMGLGGYFPS